MEANLLLNSHSGKYALWPSAFHQMCNVHFSFQDSDSPLPPQTFIKANKGSLSYFLMLVVFDVLVIIEAVTEISLLSMGVLPSTIIIPILFVFTTLMEMYVLLDDVIMLTSSQQQEIVCKILIKILYNMHPNK